MPLPDDFRWFRRPNGEHVFICQCRIRDRVFPSMTQKLGYVRRKNDGRWEWFRCPQAYNPLWDVPKHVQGVMDTVEEAKAKVEEGAANEVTSQSLG